MTGRLSTLIVLLLYAFGCQQESTERRSLNPIRTLTTLPYYNEATFKPNWIEEGSPELKEYHRIPDFSLINQNGQTITNAEFKGKVYVADFFFTSCPGICPKMTANMTILQETFKDEPNVLLLSHSVTPVKDSVPVLKEYALKKGVNDEKWHLVTGERDQIYALGRSAYFVEEDLGLERDSDDFLHTENFVLIDQKGYIRGIYNGLNKASIEQLSEDIKLLLDK